jgi:hypothetical protein
MTKTLRALLLALATFVFAMFGRSTGGGGDGGVWILPQSRHVCSLPTSGAQVMTPPRDWRLLSAPKTGLDMKLPIEMGVSAALIVDRHTRIPLPVVIVGKTMTLPLQAMQALLASPGAGIADGLVLDASGRGFYVIVRRISATDLRVEIY